MCKIDSSVQKWSDRIFLLDGDVSINSYIFLWRALRCGFFAPLGNKSEWEIGDRWSDPVHLNFSNRANCTLIWQKTHVIRNCAQIFITFWYKWLIYHDFRKIWENNRYLSRCLSHPTPTQSNTRGQIEQIYTLIFSVYKFWMNLTYRIYSLWETLISSFLNESFQKKPRWSIPVVYFLEKLLTLSPESREQPGSPTLAKRTHES